MTPHPDLSAPATTADASRRVALVVVLACVMAILVSGCGGSTYRPSDVREPRAPHLRASISPWAPRTRTTRTTRTTTVDPAVVTRVSLDDILTYADSRAPALYVARATRARVGAARTAARPALPDNPVVELSGGPRIASGSTGVDLEIGATQAIEVSGERGRRLAAAERLAELTEAEIEVARWTVHCDVHSAFHRAIVLRERAALAARVLVFQEEVGSVLARRIAAGDAAPLETGIAQLEVAQARQSSVAAAQAYLAARLELAQLAGWPITRPPEPIGRIDPPRAPPPLDDLLRVARRREPWTRLRAAAIREARARVAVADREASMRPALGVRYQVESLGAPEGAQHVVVGTLALPLPTFRRNQGERARARADVVVAEAEQRAAFETLRAGIARARAAVIAAAERVRSYGEDVLPRVEQTITLLGRSFELGEIGLLDVLVARERFLRVQSDVLQAELDYVTALAELERAVGVEISLGAHDGEEPVR
ncbi:MAG: TolC family protein [Deltaproteobacteria bacterium]|nr:TolC family protein [Deltaproteobacteria bacterium]